MFYIYIYSKNAHNRDTLSNSNTYGEVTLGSILKAVMAAG